MCGGTVCPGTPLSSRRRPLAHAFCCCYRTMIRPASQLAFCARSVLSCERCRAACCCAMRHRKRRQPRPLRPPLPRPRRRFANRRATAALFTRLSDHIVAKPPKFTADARSPAFRRWRCRFIFPESHALQCAGGCAWRRVPGRLRVRLCRCRSRAQPEAPRCCRTTARTRLELGFRLIGAQQVDMYCRMPVGPLDWGESSIAQRANSSRLRPSLRFISEISLTISFSSLAGGSMVLLIYSMYRGVCLRANSTDT